MRYLIVLIAVIYAAGVHTPSLAQGRGKGQANRPQAGKTGGSGKVDHAQPKPTRTPPPQTSAGKSRAGKTETHPRGNPHKAPAVTPVTIVTPTTPVTRRVNNPRLEAKLLSLLPPGTNIQDASQGFKNWGQFVAAVHVSNNLGLPFDSLKTAMTGITPGTTPGTGGTAPMSLGQAIQSLKGDAAETDGSTMSRTKIRTEVKKAEDAASDDLRRTSGDN